MRARHLMGLVATLFGVCAAESASADFGQVGYFSTTQQASVVDSATGINNVVKVNDGLKCYDISSGNLLNCPFTYTVLGIAETSLLEAHGYHNVDLGFAPFLIEGGHSHSLSSRPLAYPGNGDVLTLTGGTKTSSGNLTISGETRNQTVEVNYPLPESAGIYAAEIIITTPSGYVCALNCWDIKTSKFVDFVHVGYYKPGHSQGLFDDNAPFDQSYEFVADDTGHTLDDGTPLGDYLSDEATLKLQELVVNYYFRENQAGLRFNDMSLPVGGLFDYNRSWHPPHDTHRDGRAVDVSRTDMAGFFAECQDNHELRKTVEHNVGYNTPQGEPYHCEPQHNLDGSIIFDEDGHKTEFIHINLLPQLRP
jgi:hypothetical protein